jgi:hypothetical protein
MASQTLAQESDQCLYCKLLRLKDCNMRQVTWPDRCTKCIERNFPCTSVHPISEFGKKQELRLEWLEQMIREQEVSRLMKEILCHLNTNQSIGASTTLAPNSILANRVTEPTADAATQIANTVTQPTTNMATQLPASNKLTAIVQFPVTPMAAPPNVLEVEGENNGERDDGGGIYTRRRNPHFLVNPKPQGKLCAGRVCL